MPRNISNPETSELESLKKWNAFYINNAFSFIICCDSCGKWRKTSEFEEKSDVPEYWDCSMWITNDGQKGNCGIPSDVNENDYVNEEYTPGSLVWARMNGHPKWPAMVEDDPDEEEYCKDLETDAKYHVVFLSDPPTRCWMNAKRLEPFKLPSSDEAKSVKGKKLKIALEEADCAFKMKKESRLLKYSFGARLKRTKENKEKSSNAKTAQRKRLIPKDAGGSSEVKNVRKRSRRRNGGKTPAPKNDRKKIVLQSYSCGNVIINFVFDDSDSDEDSHTRKTFGSFIDNKYPPLFKT